MTSFINGNGATNSEGNKMIDMDKITKEMIEFTNTIKSEDRIVPKKWFKSKSHISQRIL